MQSWITQTVNVAYVPQVSVFASFSQAYIKSIAFDYKDEYPSTVQIFIP
jgi:hypothetical protein